MEGTLTSLKLIKISRQQISLFNSTVHFQLNTRDLSAIKVSRPLYNKKVLSA